MPGGLRFKLNRKGVRQILRSPQVEADLKRRAENVAQQAGEGFEVDTFVGKNRARADVFTATHAARKAEAEERALTRAIDAARR